MLTKSVPVASELVVIHDSSKLDRNRRPNCSPLLFSRAQASHAVTARWLPTIRVRPCECARLSFSPQADARFGRTHPQSKTTTRTLPATLNFQPLAYCALLDPSNHQLMRCKRQENYLTSPACGVKSALTSLRSTERNLFGSGQQKNRRNIIHQHQLEAKLTNLEKCFWCHGTWMCKMLGCMGDPDQLIILVYRRFQFLFS